MAQNLWSKRFLTQWLVTGEGSYFDWVWSEESLVIELIDHIVHLDFWVLGLLENRLVCEIRDEERIFGFFEGKGRGVSQDGEYDFEISFFIEFENFAIFRYAVDLFVNAEGRG